MGTVPQIARVTSVPKGATYDSEVTISWFDQERCSHKPIWLRGFTPSSKFDDDVIAISDILLYDITFNAKAKTLKKSTREELQRMYSDLKENEWKAAMRKSRRKRF